MESVIITKNILIVYAHPEPTSLTHELVEVATKTLQEQGHHQLHEQDLRRCAENAGCGLRFEGRHGGGHQVQDSAAHRGGDAL